MNDRSYMLCHDEYIAYGGGGGYGLWMDAALQSCSSVKCNTYNNECICSSEHAKIVTVEAYVLLPPTRRGSADLTFDTTRL